MLLGVVGCWDESVLGMTMSAERGFWMVDVNGAEMESTSTLEP